NNSKVTEYVYNIDGTVQKQINPNNVTSYEYYFDKKLKRLTTKDLSDILIEEDYYEYDNNNNILKENDKIYTYDALNRLKTAQNTEYSYDMAGNILSKSELDGNDLKVTTYEYNAKNQLTKTTTVENLTPVSESTYTYDNNGNQLTETTGSETKTNTYNPRNELVEVKNGQTVTANYTYNSLGKRIQKKVGTEEINYVYDEDRIILELDALYNQISSNTFGLALIKRTTTEDGYYVYNGHGDVKKLVNDSNIVLNTYEYDEFGKILSETGSFNNPYKYAGYYYDNETATYYLQARYYNPQIQRFISEDTYRGEIDDPLSLNLYAYCSNNPMIYVDPTGHWAILDDLIAAGVGAITGALGQLASDLVSSALNGEFKLSNWQTYVGATIGGAIGGWASLYASPVVGIAIGSGLSTGITQSLENITGVKQYSFKEIMQNSVFDAFIGGTVGLLLPSPKITGITAGRGNMASVFEAGLTKINNNIVKNMSTKVISKGIVSNVLKDINQSIVYGIKDYTSDNMNIINKRKKQNLKFSPDLN
ncbi:MAG: RHS repeat-associated core domain-containing protein, partial [Clostridia bacterium]|nr:RHS repeat-associated core domain-containing protein [Clostridia bacterium]